MKKKVSLSLIMLTLCASLFVGGCSCGKEPENPNSKVILATDISLDKNIITDATIGVPISITYTINPSNTTDKTMIIQSSDTSVATVDKSEVTDTLSSTIVVTPVGVGTVNIVFTWSGTFDNNVDSEDRTLTKATKIYVVGEYGKETLSTPTGLNYADGKFTWNKVSYGTDGVEAEPKYELTLTGGATPTTPITLDTNEYSDLVLTAGVEYTAKVKAKPSEDLQYFYTASAYSEEITICKLNAVDTMSVENGVVSWGPVEKANKYIVNVNGVDVETITAIENQHLFTFDTKDYFEEEVTSVTLKVKAICDTNDLVFDGDYSVNNPTIYQLGKTSGYSLTKNADGTTTLTWETVEHANKYALEIYKIGTDTAIVTINDLTSNTYILDNTFTDSYKVRVKALGDNYTLPGEFSDYYQFEKKNINDLNVSLTDGVVTLSIDDAEDCDVVISIIDNENVKTKTFSANDGESSITGSFEVSELTSSGSYIVTAQLIPKSTASVIFSDVKRVGHNYDLEIVQNNDYTASIKWDRLNTAEDYTIVFEQSSVSVKSESVQNVTNGKVEYVVPADLASGNYNVRIDVNTSPNEQAGGYSEYIQLSKIDVSNINTTFSDNVLTISTSDGAVGSVVVFIGGDTTETITLNSLPSEIDFKEKGYATGSYTVSIQALPVEDTNNIPSNVLLLSSVQVRVIANPEVSSVSALGLITWNTDVTYSKYNVYIDHGTDNSINYFGETGNTLQLNISALSTGEHTVYVEAIPAEGYLPSSDYNSFAFTKLGRVSNIKLENGVITWDAVEDAGSYSISGNGIVNEIVNTNSCTPDLAQVQISNIYSIVALGNGVNSINSQSASVQMINKVEAVSDLKVVDGVITWQKESSIVYNFYVDDVKIDNIETYNFAGLEEDVYAKLHIIGTRAGYFDSDISNIFYIKKLGKVANVTISSTDKTTYVISWDAVENASGYIVRYNGTNYPVSKDNNSCTVIGELLGGDYTITVQAISAGSDVLTDGEKNYNYINGDQSEIKAFSKLSTPTDISITSERLTWTNPSTAIVSYYELQYALDVAGDKAWTTRALSDSTSADLSFISTAGTYLVKLRAVSVGADILSSDYSTESSIVKLSAVSNLKVSNGEIVWDSASSDPDAYTYDVSVYTKDEGIEIPYGEIATGVTANSYTIPNMSTELEYYLKVKVRNAQGLELPSEYTSELKVIKLIAPLNFMVANAKATWSRASYLDATYRLSLVKADDSSTPELYDRGAEDLLFDIPTTLDAKTKYNLKIMAKGTLDSADTMMGYLNSDYSAELELYKLASISNLRVEDGLVKWDLTHNAEDEYQPVDFFIILYKNGDTLTSQDYVLATNETSLDLSSIDTGTYKIEFYVRGDGAYILNSNVSLLGEAEPIKKLATPTGIRMEKGVLVWDEVDNSTEVNYVLYNDDVQFITKTASDRAYYPEAETNIEYHISIKAIMANAIYSDISESITISKLSKVTGFNIKDGKFVWNKVENASGYTVVVSYQEQDKDEEGNPKVDPDDQTPIMVEKTMDIYIDGGNTVEYAITGVELPTEYSIEKVYAVGNTTSNHLTKGWFSSNATDLDGLFTPLSQVSGLTVKNGVFEWQKVTGAGYYSIQILQGEDNVVKTDTTTGTSYRVSDDINVPAGTYTMRVTPVSTSDTYITTNVYSETEFKKLGVLDCISVKDGYLAWNIRTQDILDAYNYGIEDSTGIENPDEEGDPENPEGKEDTGKEISDEGDMGEDPGAGDMGGDAGGEGEGSGIKEVFDMNLFYDFQETALRPYVDDELTNKFYSLIYVNLIMFNNANNKTIKKVVQPVRLDYSDGQFVTCYYFVDVEVDTWNIKIGSKGNTVSADSTTQMRFVDGVLPAENLVATKLTAPLSPVHYDSTMVVNGLLTFTPVRDVNNIIQTKYIIEFVPANSPGDPMIYDIYTISDSDSITVQTIDLRAIGKTKGLRENTAYNINIRAFGTENSTDDSEGETKNYLNSDTPAVAPLIILGQVVVSVKDGEINWSSSPANSFLFELIKPDGTKIEEELDPTVTNYSLEGDEFPVGEYKVRVKAVGDEITKLSSSYSEQATIIKLGEISSIKLASGAFVWDNQNKDLAQNGYEVIIIRTRVTYDGETIVDELEPIKIEQSTGVNTINFELPDEYPSYETEENGYNSIWKYSIKVRMLGTADTAATHTGLYVNGDFSEASYSYRRLNTPTNIKVTKDTISWNQVSGASSYQVVISGEGVALVTESGETETRVNVGNVNSITLDNEFGPGTYTIKIRALGQTSDISNPTLGYITSAYSSEITVVRTAEPNLRVERGEVKWNSAESLPFEATKYVRITINGTQLEDIENINNNIWFDFDTDDYPAGTYTITVQLIGNSELITDTPAGGEDAGDDGEDEGEGDQGDPGIDTYNADTSGFYYLSSNIATKTFTKIAKPSITLSKIVDEESNEEYNAIVWDSIENASCYDVFVVTESTEFIGEDDPETPEDERVETTVINTEVYKVDEYASYFGVDSATGKNYFTLQDIEYDDYKIYIRAVGDNVRYISSTRAEEIHVHIPIAPTNFKYDAVTGTISWTNVTESSKIVLDIKKLNNSNSEYDIEVYPGGKVLDAGTTSFKLSEIAEYQARIKARLEISGGNSYDSDYNENTLTINFNLFNGGSGTSASPYKITKETELYNIRYFMSGRYFSIVDDIVLDMYSNWETIGSKNESFTGVINGGNHTISNIKYTESSYVDVAFIHTVGESGDTISRVKNLNLDVSITSEYAVKAQYFAGIAIDNYATIENCNVSGSVFINGTTSSDNAYAGAVIHNYGTIKRVINNLDIEANRYSSGSTAYTRVGGITADNIGTITECGNEAYLIGQYVGGITADNYQSITKSYNKGLLEIITNGFASGSIALGGIAARNNTNIYGSGGGTISTCYVISKSKTVNFEAHAGFTVENNNTGTSFKAYVGGLVGNNTYTVVNSISDCYVVLESYASVGQGSAVVASLVANVVNNLSTFYQVLNNCYAYSTVAYYISNSTTNIKDSDLTGTSATNYIGRITGVDSISGASGVVIINGITCAETNGYLPKLSWEE